MRRVCQNLHVMPEAHQIRPWNTIQDPGYQGELTANLCRSDRPLNWAVFEAMFP